MARAPQHIEIDELPEADRLEGFPHPRHARALFGHDTVEEMLREAVAGGRMHHGWLITGPQGIGKATLAYRLARFLVAKPDERAAAPGLAIADETTASRQVRALSHPGLLVLRRPYNLKDKRFPTTIPIDEVRRLRGFLSHSAGEGAWRVVIVDTADEFNVNAANALLKSLEEPPPRTVFLLISSEPGRLLATIRSRCRMLELAPLDRESLRRAVRQALAGSETGEPDPSDWPTLERLAQGSVRRVLALQAAGGLDLYARVLKLVSALPAVDWGAVHALGDELGGNAAEQRFELFFELVLDLIARLVRAAATGEGPGDEVALAARVIGPVRLATFAELWERVARAKADAIALNLDRKALILDMVRELEAAARS
ncbi:MAG: DNA polymerase III subunit delta' [Hyphomicrobium sp.]